MRRLAACLMLAAWLAGCGFTPIEVPDPSGIKPGPGLLTGESGEFVIPGPR